MPFNPSYQNRNDRRPFSGPSVKDSQGCDSVPILAANYRLELKTFPKPELVTGSWQCESQGGGVLQEVN